MILFAALYVRLIRANVMETMNEDYVRTARAKGASQRRVMVQHVLRNSMLPVVTILGMDLGLALGGAIFTESIFNLPGLGREIIQAYNRADLPLITGIVVFSTRRGDRVQFPRGRHLRLPRPADPAELMAAAARSQGPQHLVPHGRRHRPGRLRRQLRARQGEDARRRRRVRLGQERHVPHRDGARRPAAGDGQRLGAARGRGDARREPVAHAADPRPARSG